MTIKADYIIFGTSILVPNALNVITNIKSTAFESVEITVVTYKDEIDKSTFSAIPLSKRVFYLDQNDPSWVNYFSESKLDEGGVNVQSCGEAYLVNTVPEFSGGVIVP